MSDGWKKVLDEIPGKKTKSWTKFAGAAIGQSLVSTIDTIRDGVDFVDHKLQEHKAKRDREKLERYQTISDPAELVRLAEILKSQLSTENLIQETIQEFILQCMAGKGFVPTSLLCQGMMWIANEVIHIPDPPLHAGVLDGVEGARARDELRAYLATYSPPEKAREKIKTTLLYYFHSVLESLPHIALTTVDELKKETPDTFTIPLIDLVDVPKTVEQIILPFYAPDVRGTLHFQKLRQQLDENIFKASGVPFTPENRGSTDLIMPTEYKGEPNEILNAYLLETPLRLLFFTPVPFIIPRKAFSAHGAIFAPSNHGKTQLLQNFIATFLQEDDPPGMFIIDSHGDMLSKLERLEIFDPEKGRLKDRLLILDPKDAPPLNLFSLGTKEYSQWITELFIYLFTAIDSDLTVKQATAVMYLMKLMKAIPDATVDTLREVMEEDGKTPKYQHIIETFDQRTQDFFRRQFYVKSEMGQTRAQVARRLYTLLANPLFVKMFSATENCFNAFEAMQRKKVCLLHTSEASLGPTASAVLGRFYIAQLLAAAFQRGEIPEHQRHLVLLIVDEAHQYFDHQTERILAQARKFGLGFLFATQYLEQMDRDVKAAVNGNTLIKLAGPVSFSDANALGKEMYTTGEFIRSMQSREKQHTEFACFVRNLTPAAVRLTVPFGTLEKQPQMTEGARLVLRTGNKTWKKKPALAPSPAPATPQADPFGRRPGDPPSKW